MKTVAIVGGGIGGLLTSIQLVKAGIRCQLFEKKRYPFHRVCGEYISNEAVPFLESQGLFPHQFNPPRITRFQLSSIAGKQQVLPLDLGGFGISRYSFDNFLCQQAIRAGVEVEVDASVERIEFDNKTFRVHVNKSVHEFDVVVGAFGKRSNIDVKMNRDFVKKRSPYVGIKYHIRTNHPGDVIALHNFPGGYCGLSNVEEGKSNLCYLVHRDKLKEIGSIPKLETEVLCRNPFLSDIFRESEFLFDRPETINEISFENKAPIEHHMLLVGDSSGMIAPLCGNGMAMAMRASRLASEFIRRFCTDVNYSRAQLEHDYTGAWRNSFQTRLWAGRQLQRLFGSETASALAVNLAIYARPVAKAIMRNTHGKPFD